MATRTASTEATPWVAPEKIDQYVQTEPALVMISLAIGAGLIYKLVLRNISEERHQSLRENFKNLAIHLATGAFLFLVYRALGQLETGDPHAVERLSTYVGLAAIIQGAIVLVKICRIFIFE
ncbi:MAG TPA: hypothetical protein VM598_01550, partial [Bdellovibrionota bacterium]|nr:hypothetical protein [Bdellovibrionota bacterium]